MTAFFDLTLDTTKPTIELFAPTSISSWEYFLVYLESNETLDSFQDFNLIDSAGRIYPLTLARTSPTEFEGIIQIENATPGVGKITATVRDEVFNTSYTEFPIVILSSNKRIQICIEKQKRGIDIIAKERTIETVDSIKQIEINAYQKTIDTNWNNKNIDIAVLSEDCEV